MTSYTLSTKQHRQLRLQSRPITTKLIDLGLTDKTIKIYKKALHSFLYSYVFNSNMHSIIVNDSTTAAEWDVMLGDYIQYLFETLQPLSLANNTYHSFVHYVPALYSSLPYSKHLLKQWNKYHSRFDHRSHPPINWDLTVLIATCLARSGYHHESMATLLAFDCLLRKSELLSLKLKDVAFNNDARTGSSINQHTIAIRLTKTKTGKDQYVVLLNPSVARLLKFHYHRRLKKDKASNDDLLFPISSFQYSKSFHLACSTVGLGHIPFVPHSLRHGGATHCYMNGMTIETILHRGRWKSTASAAIYVRSGFSLLLSQEIPQSIFQQGKLIAEQLFNSLGPILFPFFRRFQQQ